MKVVEINVGVWSGADHLEFFFSSGLSGSELCFGFRVEIEWN